MAQGYTTQALIIAVSAIYELTKTPLKVMAVGVITRIIICPRPVAMQELGIYVAILGRIFGSRYMGRQ